MCGDCCDPVWYPLGPADLRQSSLTAVGGPHEPDLVFAAAHWRPTGEVRDGLHGYSCDRFDSDTRLCTAHEERPPICRGYPWYDGEPGEHVRLPLRCSFRADLAAVDRNTANVTGC